MRGCRDFLRKKYTAATRKERFGFENVDDVSPPQWNAQHPPQKLEIIFGPAIQEWIDFRCQSMSDALYRMAKVAKSWLAFLTGVPYRSVKWSKLTAADPFQPT